jgi:protocatechuate 3,4-dioxygenase beta subunit
MHSGRSEKNKEVFVRRFVLTLLAMAACLGAQEFRGTLTGRVTDPSGSGVPNAKIVVTQTETNARSQTVSGPDGNYTVPFLAPGVYQIAAEANGFSRFVQTGIRVSAVEQVTVNPAMQVGSITQSVEVNADAAPLETATASQG